MKNKQSYKAALGLAYDKRLTGAPSVNIIGEEIEADEIVKIAQRFGVPVVEQPMLCDALKDYELDQEIPKDLYEPVALILNALELKQEK